MEQYAKADKASNLLNENADCAVVAVSIATKTPYLITHAVFEKLGRKRRSKTFDPLIRKAVDALGYKMVQCTSEFKHHKTVNRISESLPAENFLITIKGHILAAYKGEIQDWTKGRQHRVNEVYRVVKNPITFPTRSLPRPSVLKTKVVKVKPATKQGKPRQKGAVRDIWMFADRAWRAAGEPLDSVTLKALRKAWKAELCNDYNPTTISCQLLSWEKTLEIYR